MPTIDFERLDWEDYPSTETPLSAENLNRLEDAMEGIYDDVGGQEETIANILGNFAYIEPTSTASKDYLAGDLLVRGDYMYKAIIPIQTDDALVEGTNITKTTVSSELGVDVFSNFAYIERSNVATKNYTVGSHVLLNNILYVVTSAVETGENLVVDMNIEQTTVCDELEKETGSVASAVGYDNTTSGLTATNVQDAVDELASPAAEGVSYDNTESGLTATDVQGALDELDSSKSCNKYYSWFFQPTADTTGTYSQPKIFFNESFTMPYDGYVTFCFHQIMKTSKYTAIVEFSVDDQPKCNAGTNSQTPIYVSRTYRMYLNKGTHNAKLKLFGQASSDAIGTLSAYNGYGLWLNIE